MKSLRLLIKPASANCNLRCEYCFYEDEAKKRKEFSYGFMDESIAEILIKKAMEVSEGMVEFGFQGGEPILAGLPFFQSFTQMVRSYNKTNATVLYTLQTNGSLLDTNWCSFLKQENFLVGISLDGIKSVHDKLRKDKKGDGTFLSVMKAIDLLKRYEIPFHVLTVLSKETAVRIERIYRFYEKNHICYQQYIPCLDPYGETRGERSYSLKPEQYKEALKHLFDLWFQSYLDGKYCSIRQFENYITMLRGGLPESCSMSGRCSMQNIIEANGDVYSCDFYAMDSYCLGNIKERSLEELFEISKQFQKTSHTIEKICEKCRWYPLCRGGCRRDREQMDGRIGLNYYCEAYQGFFEYTIERLEYLASKL